MYWTQEERHPYILKYDGKLAGFVLERFNEDGMKKYKGKWEIRTLLKNKRAQEFWRKVVKSASNGNYKERFIRDNTRYAFYFEN